MPTRRISARLAVVLLAAGAPATGQDVELGWFSVDCGGGQSLSAVGDVELLGTIGQLDAGRMTGGAFAITGGFWAVTATGTACPSSSSPLPDLIGAEVSTKNRFLSFRVADAGQMQAIRVTLSELLAPFANWNGATLWVGAPFDVSELGSKDDGTPPTFNATFLQCDPFFMDWGAVGVVHVFDAGIVPNSVYEVQVINRGCSVDAEQNFSEALVLPTSAWGDAVGVFDGGAGAWTAPNGTVDVAFDVVALLDKFANRPGAPIKARADLEPAIIDFKINITDVTRALDAFAGQPFPFLPGPMPCTQELHLYRSPR